MIPTVPNAPIRSTRLGAYLFSEDTAPRGGVSWKAADLPAIERARAASTQPALADVSRLLRGTGHTDLKLGELEKGRAALRIR